MMEAKRWQLCQSSGPKSLSKNERGEALIAHSDRSGIRTLNHKSSKLKKKKKRPNQGSNGLHFTIRQVLLT